MFWKIISELWLSWNMLPERRTETWGLYVFSLNRNSRLLWFLTLRMFVTETTKHCFFSHRSHRRIWSQIQLESFVLVALLCCLDSFMVSLEFALGLCRHHGFRPLHSGTVAQSSPQESGEIEWGQTLIDGVYLNVLCSVELLSREESRFIISAPPPLLTNSKVTGPHTVVLAVSFHRWRTWGKPICGTTLCLRREAFTGNCTGVNMWLMTLMVTYSRKCVSVGPQLPLLPPPTHRLVNLWWAVVCCASDH